MRMVKKTLRRLNMANSFSNELNMLIPYFDEGFERELLIAAFNGLSHSGKLRPNNFAFAVRHLIDIFLRKMAPDAEIIQCSWYTNRHPNPDENPDHVSHGQRMHYALITGMRLDHEALRFLDFEGRVNYLEEKRNRLNKYTHISTRLFSISEDEQDSELEDIIEALCMYMVGFDELKEEIETSVEASISMDIFDEYINSNDLDLMEISRGYLIEGIQNEENELLKIDRSHISFRVSGTVYVTQMLGPSRDSVDINSDYPFTCEVWFPSSANSWVNGEVHNLTTDTSSWFE